mmetsp:Transcript_7888/g.13638  ORF Transcript_7888/g.13638 Transcript_7888/m.13638 type:complete len:246 (+) Transcript_7888:249-986(+)
MAPGAHHKLESPIPEGSGHGLIHCILHRLPRLLRGLHYLFDRKVHGLFDVALQRGLIQHQCGPRLRQLSGARQAYQINIEMQMGLALTLELNFQTLAEAPARLLLHRPARFHVPSLPEVKLVVGEPQLGRALVNLQRHARSARGLKTEPPSILHDLQLGVWVLEHLRVEERRLIHVRAILGGCILKMVARLGPKRGHCVRHTVLGEEHNQIPVLKPVRVLTWYPSCGWPITLSSCTSRNKKVEHC